MLALDLKHVVGVDQLTPDEWAQYSRDIRLAAAAIRRAFSPDHMNVESLGNVVPHLHFHIIPRYKDDGRWRGPIWLTRQEEMPNRRLSEAEYSRLATAIIGAFADAT